MQEARDVPSIRIRRAKGVLKAGVEHTRGSSDRAQRVAKQCGSAAPRAQPRGGALSHHQLQPHAAPSCTARAAHAARAARAAPGVCRLGLQWRRLRPTTPIGEHVPRAKEHVAFAASDGVCESQLLGQHMIQQSCVHWDCERGAQ